jgi:hypothetical protein
MDFVESSGLQPGRFPGTSSSSGLAVQSVLLLIISLLEVSGLDIQTMGKNGDVCNGLMCTKVGIFIQIELFTRASFFLNPVFHINAVEAVSILSHYGDCHNII